MRTVGVKLAADVSDYMRKLQSAQKETADFTGELSTLARNGSLDAVADSATRMGRQAGAAFEKTTADASRLDRQIDELERSIDSLSQEIMRTGNLELFGDLDKMQTRLRKALNVRDLFSAQDVAAAGASVGVTFGTSMATTTGKTLATAGPIIAPAVAALVAGAAPVLGAGLSAAVVGGAAGLGVVGGFVLAARDPAVKAAADRMGATVLGVLTTSASSFRGPVLASISFMEGEFSRLEGRFTNIFRNSSNYVAPLLGGVAAAFDDVTAGIDVMVSKAGPAVAVISRGIAGLGDAAGDFLVTMADDAETNARALDLMFGSIEFGVRQITLMTNVLTEVHSWTEGWSSVLFGAVPLLEAYRAKTGEVADATLATTAAAGLATTAYSYSARALGDVDARSQATADAMTALAVQQAVLSESMSIGIERARGLSNAFDILNGAALGARQAESDYQAAIDNVTTSITRNGRTLDLHTEKGRANDQAVRDLIGTIRNKAQASYDEMAATGDAAGAQAAASRVYESGRAQLVRNLTQILGNAAAANKLADSIFHIPKAWSSTITTPGAADSRKRAADVDQGVRHIPRHWSTSISAPGASAAAAQVNNLRRAIESLPSRRVTVVEQQYVTVRTDKGGKLAGANRWGGLYEHAADGLLRDAAIYSPMGPARYAFAEPATGGEAFIPKFGDWARSMDILDRAAGWYGARVVAGNAGSSGGVGGRTHLSPQTEDYGPLFRELIRAVERVAPGVGQQLIGAASRTLQMAKAR